MVLAPAGRLSFEEVEGVTELTKLAELEPRAFIDEAEELGELEEEVLEAYAHEHELDEEQIAPQRRAVH